MNSAVDCITRARNPYGVWRYDVPPTGENDTSVTTWMTLALAEAAEAGATIDERCAPDTIRWLDAMTDPATGRVGYDAQGSPSSRVMGINDDFPTEEHETLTAAGLLCRLVLGQTPRADRVVVQHVRLLISSLPDKGEQRSPDALGTYFGARAMVQLGGRVRSEWEARTVQPFLATQCTESELAGSWNPNGAWGYSLGRVGETALVVAALAELDGGA